MLKINNDLLDELGLRSLPADEKPLMLRHIHETLQLRVGHRLAEQMTTAQIDEFEGYFAAGDDRGATNWLDANFPSYKEIVHEEFARLKTEVAAGAKQILAISG